MSSSVLSINRRTIGNIAIFYGHEWTCWSDKVNSIEFIKAQTQYMFNATTCRLYCTILQKGRDKWNIYIEFHSCILYKSQKFLEHFFHTNPCSMMTFGMLLHVVKHVWRCKMRSLWPTGDLRPWKQIGRIWFLEHFSNTISCKMKMHFRMLVDLRRTVCRVVK